MPVLAPNPTDAPATPGDAKPEYGLMEGTAWLSNGKGLTFTDPARLQRLRRKELSASFAQNLAPDSCSAGMVAGVLLPRDDGPFEQNQLGTGAHGVLELLMQMAKVERTKAQADATLRKLIADRDYALQVYDEQLTDAVRALSTEEQERWFSEVQRRVHGLWQIEDPTQVDVYFTEMAFGRRNARFVLIGRVPFVGFIDRVDEIRDPNTGEVIGYAVTDYKAGKYKEATKFGDDYGDQIRLYVVAVHNATGVRPTRGELHFIGEGKKRTIDVTPEAIDGTVRAFERAWDRLHQLVRDNMFPTVSGPLCGWCPLVNVCPTAKREGKSDLSNTKKANGRRVVIEGMAPRALPVGDVVMDTVDEPVAFELEPLELPEEILTLLAQIPTAPAASNVAPADAAHSPISSTTRQETQKMSDAQTTAVYKEQGQARDATIGGSLNPGSPAAVSVFDLTSLAVELLHDARREVTPITVKALTYSFAHIIQEVQFGLSGSAEYQDNLNARLRVALRTVLKTKPLPWGEPEATWDDWARKSTNRLRAIASVANQVFQAGRTIPETPWRDLVQAAAPDN